MNDSVEALLVGLGAFLAGSGSFWVYLRGKYERRDKERDAYVALIMGLTHDKIVTMGIGFIEKGWVNKDEYDDLIKYFWEPYSALGGNGSAERIVNLVKILPLKPEQRQFPTMRKIQDSLHQGTEGVISELKKGEDGFERNN